MQQDPPEAPVRGPGAGAWLRRGFAVAVLVVSVLVVARLDVLGGAAEPTAAERAATVATELRQRMTTTLQDLPPDQHGGHGGHATAAGASATVCGVRVYGYEPADAPTVDAVDVVYGFHMCALAEPGLTWHWAPKFVAPTVMRFHTDPPGIEMAESTGGTTYQDRIRELIPERYRQLAVEGALEPEVMADLQRRYQAAVAALPSPTPTAPPAGG